MRKREVRRYRRLSQLLNYQSFLAVLKWFLEKDFAHKAMYDKVLVEEEFVKTRPERVPMNCTADDVAIH